MDVQGAVTPSFLSPPMQRVPSQCAHQCARAAAGPSQNGFYVDGPPMLDHWMEQENAVFTQFGQKPPQPRDQPAPYFENNGSLEAQRPAGHLSRSCIHRDRYFPWSKDALDTFGEDGRANPQS